MVESQNKVITIRLPNDLEKVLRETARDNRTTISYVMIDCLRKKFNLPDNDNFGNNIS